MGARLKDKGGEEGRVKEGNMGVNEHCPGGEAERESWQLPAASTAHIYRLKLFR